jgi:hypothetical protein
MKMGNGILYKEADKLDSEKDIPHHVYIKKRRMMGGGVSDGLYGLGFVGALIYYLQHATTLGAGIIGFFKAMVWPAFLIYKLLEYLKM